MQEYDDSARLVGALVEAYEKKCALCLCGTGSKKFLGKEVKGDILSVVEHRGILDYRPEELVITARAGTRLDELSSALASHNQFLPFDPPQYNGLGTLGGALASGLSGPGRAWLGSARDAALGMEIINGMGQRLKFGGKVLKNVAGYDVTRLMTGSFGTLGLILSASVRLLPSPVHTETIRLELDRDAALDYVLQLMRSANPVTATSHYENGLYIRLSGSEAGLLRAIKKIGGHKIENGASFWTGIRDHKHKFFTGNTVWRFSVPAAAKYPDLPGEWMTEWAGSLRWLKTEVKNKIQIQRILLSANESGGSVRCYPTYSDDAYAAQSAEQLYISKLSPEIMKYHMRIKKAFDPAGILNTNIMYREF
ncbi:MAG: glycolate oxidase subunit GlcE [Pseudomonadales bacterium]|nr:glycolate oxidase subunit GlcE [Pseudomonadales bacterium]